jgi:RecJ-like exonuclease
MTFLCTTCKGRGHIAGQGEPTVCPNCDGWGYSSTKQSPPAARRRRVAEKLVVRKAHKYLKRQRL